MEESPSNGFPYLGVAEFARRNKRWLFSPQERIHSMVIAGGVLQENPLYVPPEQFLEELQGRHQH